MSKINPKLKEKLRRAIKARFDAREAYWQSLDDPDSIEAVDLIKNVVKTKKHLKKVMAML